MLVAHVLACQRVERQCQKHQGQQLAQKAAGNHRHHGPRARQRPHEGEGGRGQQGMPAQADPVMELRCGDGRAPDRGALLVASSVAGAVPGSTLNTAGTRISPPPPTIESTKPANKEARGSTSISMAKLSHPELLSIS
jgi:hypothetical protein